MGVAGKHTKGRLPENSLFQRPKQGKPEEPALGSASTGHFRLGPFRAHFSEPGLWLVLGPSHFHCANASPACSAAEESADANRGLFFLPDLILFGLCFLIAGICDAKGFPKRVGESQSPYIMPETKALWTLSRRAGGRRASQTRIGRSGGCTYRPAAPRRPGSGSRDLLAGVRLSPQNREAARGTIIANLWPG